MNKSKDMSLGAMITVLSIILLYMTTVILTTRIFLVSLSSFLIAILIIEVGVRTALLSFVATSLLSIVLVPNKILLIPYISFLGYYGIIKSYIESLDNIFLEWIIKLIVFNIASILNYLFLTNVIGINLKVPFSIGFLIIVLQVLFVIYDYVFSMFISYYNTKLRKYIL